MDKGQITALFNACDLLSAADTMQRQVDDDGLVVNGSQGQPVAHPLIAEIRQYRRAALESLRRVGLESRSAASSAAAALASKRWSSKPPSGNVTPLRDRA